MISFPPNIVLDILADRLRAAGYFVGNPRPAPAVGSVWTPTRSQAAPRRVTAVSRANRHGRSVVYVSNGLPDCCTLATWHRWVTRTRAQAAAATEAAP